VRHLDASFGWNGELNVSFVDGMKSYPAQITTVAVDANPSSADDAVLVLLHLLLSRHFCLRARPDLPGKDLKSLLELGGER
jgi:hypothetical protein